MCSCGQLLLGHQRLVFSHLPINGGNGGDSQGWQLYGRQELNLRRFILVPLPAILF